MLKYDCKINSQNLPKRSLGDVLSLRHSNHFVLAGANNRNVIITYRFLAAPVQANRDFFYIDCMTVYFNCKYFPWYTRELLGCLLRISPSGRNPCRGNDASLPGSGSCFWLVESNFPRGMTNQKHYPGLDSDASSAWNFCACFSDETSFRGETSGGVPKCPLRLDVINLDYQPLFEKWAPLWMVVSRSI